MDKKSPICLILALTVLFLSSGCTSTPQSRNAAPQRQPNLTPASVISPEGGVAYLGPNQQLSSIVSPEGDVSNS